VDKKLSDESGQRGTIVELKKREYLLYFIAFEETKYAIFNM